MKLILITAALTLHQTAATARALLSLHCAPSCPSSLCTCLSTHPHPSSCSSELHEVCSSGNIDACVPKESLVEFRALHCPYAQCLVDGGSEEGCTCELYAKVCTMHGLGEYCDTAKCCELQMDDGGRADCLGNGVEMGTKVPSKSLTGSPTELREMSMGGTGGPALVQNAFFFDWVGDDAFEPEEVLPESGEFTWVAPIDESETANTAVSITVTSTDNESTSSATATDELLVSPSVDTTFSLNLGFARFCSSNCDPLLCQCLLDKQNYASCITEMYFSCRDDTITKCVPEDFVVDFQYVYCPYAECRVLKSVEGWSQEKCDCDRYVGLCKSYGGEKDCGIAACCLKEVSDDGKRVCLGGGDSGGMIELASESLAQEDAFFTENTPAVITDAPSTKKPTKNPTQAPITDEPTAAPVTDEPTLTPTYFPSDAPMFAPVTAKPTKQPTSLPSTLPTAALLTDSPTDSPTDAPITSKPSGSPTKDPITNEPTLSPTYLPSDAPTNAPFTLKPTKKPTLMPSGSPVQAPITDEPTFSPTRVPSDTPTDSPVTEEPTAQPTPKPSIPPTVAPVTDEPTLSPSYVPSYLPITSPVSNEPTAQPTITESDKSLMITNEPTLISVSLPIMTDDTTTGSTSKPSAPPTFAPVTDEPTMNPSSSPSDAPTNAPVTDKPTKQPTPKPSSPPTAAPISDEPTLSPSFVPTELPTGAPVTSKPTTTPTPKPSDSPTLAPITPNLTLNPSGGSSGSPTDAPVTAKPTEQPTQKPVTNSPSGSPTEPPVTDKPTVSEDIISALPTSKDVTKKPVVYCPPAYDPLWSTSYSSGTQIEVDETIYECNPYPFNIYCILPSFKPVYGNELWTDAWTEISQCVATEPTSARPTTKKPTKRPTSKPTTMTPSMSPSTSEPTEGLTIEGLTTFDPTLSPSYVPTGPDKDSLVTSKPTSKPSSKPTKASLTDEPTLNPSYAPTNSVTDAPVMGKPTTPSTPNSTTTSPTVSPALPAKLNPAPSSPSDSPTASPMIEATSVVQLQMEIMTKTMNAYELFGVFQPSCKDFLTRQLISNEPHVFDIKCTVTNQQLLPVQEGLSSLLVDIETTGVVMRSENVTSSSDINFDDLVYYAFFEDSDLFITSLKNKGEVAGIDTFDDLDSVTSVRQTNQKDAISEGGGSSNQGHTTGLLAAIIIGGVAVVVLFGVVVYQLRSRAADEDSIDDGGDDLDKVIAELGIDCPPRDIHIGSNVQSEDSANRNDALTYAYSLENGIESPNSLTSIQKPSWGEEAPIKIRRVVLAPPGKLGIIIDTSSQGPIVHSVKDESVLEGLVFAGDLIVGLDDEDTSSWSAHHLTKLVASKSKCERKITVLSVVAQSK